MFEVASPPIARFTSVRNRSEEICRPLAVEDYVVQPMPEVSPPKWHLGHTTWFFESFILSPHLSGYKVFNDSYAFVFNSYYESKGSRVIRTDRGNLTRPSVQDIMLYRKYVDEHMTTLLEREPSEEIMNLLELGLHHEQQHQELLLYDIKFILGNNPLFPVYMKNGESRNVREPGEMNWLEIEEGNYEIGHKGDGFSFDNEHGLHKVYLHGARIGDRMVTNKEYLDFMEDGGYTYFGHWLSDGWAWVQSNDIKSPLHWHRVDNQWMMYSLNGGLKEIDPAAPVSHISYYEAAAYAKWAGKRLPTEFQWEAACQQYGRPELGNFSERNTLEAKPAEGDNNQLFGDLWEWTASAYLPYPYYKVPDGAVGEYNGKFMVNQMVLRGGSHATPSDHIRATYRNFFYPNHRWLFNGFRLASYD